jgi:sugar O-acyltransferase (sialic acid O-acetyltransferase NeuD family)
MKSIAIFGAGGFGREVLMLINQINKISNEWNIIGFFDDDKRKGEDINGYKILGGINEINSLDNETYLILAIGKPEIKKLILNKIENNLIKYPILIHPNVSIENNQFLEIGKGTIITSGCILTVNIKIGEHVLLNLMCTVGHDTNIGNYCSFMPSVNISGEVHIKDSVYVGTGVQIINQIQVGSNSIIGAGAVVSKSLPSNCTAVGIPAKPIKFHEK